MLSGRLSVTQLPALSFGGAPPFLDQGDRHEEITDCASIAALGALTACGGGGDDQKAENIEAAAENQADALEMQADNTTNEVASDALENRADAVRRRRRTRPKRWTTPTALRTPPTECKRPSWMRRAPGIRRPFSCLPRCRRASPSFRPAPARREFLYSAKRCRRGRRRKRVQREEARFLDLEAIRLRLADRERVEQRIVSLFPSRREKWLETKRSPATSHPTSSRTSRAAAAAADSKGRMPPPGNTQMSVRP
jgi:hypothetical protein